jgi:deazaflavin-dependent oxidoreductase (nitroreductase family)
VSARRGQRFVTGLHALLYRLSGGRIGGRLGRLEQVLLTTTGRHTGVRRTTPLSVLVDGDRLVLVASNGGSRRHPDWYLNLTADPDVVVQRGSDRLPMRARTASAEERAVLWPRAVALYGGYARYQQRTTRQIPMVVCEPLPSM